MLRRLWLLFAQAVTVCLAVWFVVAALKPEWLGRGERPAEQASAPVMGTVTLAGRTEALPAQQSYREAVARAMPAVVNINTTKEVRQPQSALLDDPFLKRFFGNRLNRTEKLRSLGSGVVVTADGYILTNNHVVETADQIEVAFEDGRKASAKLVGTDPETDLAVIKIEGKDFKPIVFGQMDSVKVGDVVLAIGNPFEVGQTVTMGIVSALGRSQLGINIYENFIQTDAAINPGNSGGALIDTSGNLLGINSAIYSKTGGSLGIGFAVPVSTAKTVMEEIISKGHVVRGWIGVEPREITTELAENLNLAKSEGVIIAAVLKNGPADKAGIRPGDILESIGGKAVPNMSEMFNMVAALKPDSKSQFVVLRGDTKVVLEVTIGKRPVRKKNVSQSQ